MADTPNIRNIALIGHRGAGKTSLAEALLHTAGVINRMGSTTAGNTVTDFDAEERSRQLSIGTAIASFEYQGTRINLLDTPGYADFLGETYGALRVADAALLVIHADAGVEVETQKVWDYCAGFGLPVIAVINHLDGERAEYDAQVAALEEKLGARPVRLQIPLGHGTGLSGMVDLVGQKAWLAGRATGDVPADVADEVESRRAELIEFAAENDEALMEKFFEGEALSAEELLAGLKIGLLDRSLVPVVGCGATKELGTGALLQVIKNLCPSPADRPGWTGVKPHSEDELARQPSADEPFSAFCFKAMTAEGRKITLMRVVSGKLSVGSTVINTNHGDKERLNTIGHVLGSHFEDTTELVAGDIIGAVKVDAKQGETLAAEGSPIIFPATQFPAPCMAVALHARSRGDEEKIGAGLNQLMEEDPSLRFYRDAETEEQILAGMGDMHLQVTLAKLSGRYGCEVDTARPKVAYRETVRTSAEANGRFKKQSGGSGQFGDVILKVAPRLRGEGYEFVDAIFGGSVPKQYIPSVDKGVVARLKEGFLAGFPMVDIEVTLADGSYHSVDSSDLAFQMAGRIGLENCVEKAGVVLLEPLWDVWITVPDDYVGDIMADLPRRRGTVMGAEGSGGLQTIRAQVPAAEMSTYATDLRSMTQGRGSFRTEFTRYEEVPGDLAQKVAAERAAAREEERK